MITKERYIELREYLDNGANLPPKNLNEMNEFEQENQLLKKEDNGFERPNLKDLRRMQSQH